MSGLAAIFFISWIAIALVTLAFYFRWDPVRKRKYWPIVVVVGMVMFSLFLMFTAPPAFLIIAIPTMLLFVLGNLRAMRFW